MTLKSISISICMAILLCACGGEDNKTVSSPNGKILVAVDDHEGEPSLYVIHDGHKVLDDAKLGLQLTNHDLTRDMRLVSVSKTTPIVDDYAMATGKRSHCHNMANERIYTFANPDGARLEVAMRAYNDGVAFRYTAYDDVAVLADGTAYTIPDGTRRWVQAFQPDSYEGFYPLATDGEPLDKHQHGQWAYPALVQTADSTFMLITEANIERGHSASHLDNSAQSQTYHVMMADNNLPMVQDQWTSPWHTLIIGQLADIVESTLVTDLSAPAPDIDTQWIDPAPVSWVYWAYNHGSNDYQIVKRYVDLAVDMGWPYVLIDAEWDEMAGGGNVVDAVNYAHSRGIKPMLWYNSSVGWIDGAPGPKFRLNDPDKRKAEMDWLRDIGVAGLKIDFFDGDQAKTMDYCQDLLQDALDRQLLVTLHGATIPRGWQRTYPNLMTVEGVYGAEWYNNKPVMTNHAAAHNATLPFTRNVVGPMDYTPGTFTDSQHPHITSHGHELALCLLFESALQHMPDRPEGYASLPADARQLLSTLPTAWDDTRLLAGYPGEYVVMARRKGDTWYVAGINGSDQPATLSASVAPLEAKGATIRLISDGNEQRVLAPTRQFVNDTDHLSVECLPRGGFVATITPN